MLVLTPRPHRCRRPQARLEAANALLEESLADKRRLMATMDELLVREHCSAWVCVLLCD